MRVALAQTSPVTGDLEGNVAQILKDIERAKEARADIVVFPETAITGYCCGALYEQHGFIEYNARFLEDVIAPRVQGGLVAIIGYVRHLGTRPDGTPDIANSVAIIQDGSVIDTYDKILLANGNHHEDKKYFTPGSESHVTTVRVGGTQVTIGTPICEDIWTKDHDRDIVREMVAKGAELIICPNYSYFSTGKQHARETLCATHAREHHVPVVYVNAAGVGDIVKNIMIYDGSSFAMNAHGEHIGNARRFGKDFEVVDLDGPALAAPETDSTAETYDALVYEQRELFRVLGIPNAQVHVSGGLDSAIVAAICAEAMGPAHLTLISNPTEYNGEVTRGNAQRIADALGVPLHWQPTQAAYETLVSGFRDAFHAEPDATAKGNMQAILRTAQGLTATRHFKSGVVATGNHTEIVLGWSTFHDIGSVGVHAPLGDLTKTEEYALARHINARADREIIPRGLYDGTVVPMAELVDAKDDPFDYHVVSGICAEMVRHSKGPQDIIDAYATRTLTPAYFPPGPDGRDVYARTTAATFEDATWDAFRRARGSVFKAAQSAPIVITSARSRGFSNRETIINAYAGKYEVRA